MPDIGCLKGRAERGLNVSWLVCLFSCWTCWRTTLCPTSASSTPPCSLSSPTTLPPKVGQACSFTYNFTTKGGTGLFFASTTLPPTVGQACSLHLYHYHQSWDSITSTTLPPKVGQAYSLHLCHRQRWDSITSTTLPPKVGQVCCLHLQLYHQR